MGDMLQSKGTVGRGVENTEGKREQRERERGGERGPYLRWGREKEPETNNDLLLNHFPIIFKNNKRYKYDCLLESIEME